MNSQARTQRWLWIGGILVLAAMVLWLFLRPDPMTGPVDLNTASSEVLESLPGVGPDLAERIIAGRPYEKLEDIMKVKGIGEATFQKMRPRLALDASPPAR